MKDILTLPFVSISIVNLNGRDYLEKCLESIKKLEYPAELIEIIIVDNGSSDNSVDFIKSNYPDAKLIKNNRNTGFAFANNQAAEAAKGEYIAFLNNDTVVDSKWLIELLRPIFGDKEVVASGSKVLSVDGSSLDFVGGMINFEGKGFQIDYGIPVEKDIHQQYEFLPFVNGGAMMINRKVFLEAGSFDQDFFAYYEDVDLGWRLWVLGYKVIFAPKSIVYHYHHGTSKNFGEDKLRFLKERNALYSVFKNYDDENLAKVFSGSLSSIFNRIFVDLKFDYKKYYDLSNINEKKYEIDDVKITKEPLSSIMAVKALFDNLPDLAKKRKKIQDNRKRDDKTLFTYFKGQFLAVSSDQDYQKKQISILDSLGIYEIFEKQIKKKLLIISSEIVTKEMAGPAIRAWNFAKVLSQHMEVLLAIPNKTDLQSNEFSIVQYTGDRQLGEIINNVDIILSGGMTFFKYPSIKDSGKYLISDIYDPYNLATLAELEAEPLKKRLEIHKSIHYIFNEQLYYGDFFICASDRQRDFWLGMLAALGRVNPYSYNEDPTLKKMIDIVPFGLPSNKPLHTRNALKGKIEGIGEEDFVVIWGGGIYNWFDPLTLIKAMAKIKEKRGDIKLFFMGVKHPNPDVRELRLVNDSVNLARKLGLYGSNIFFNFGWVDYEDRQNYLLEADVGIITHPDHIETRFSFRTRILDYLWSELPIISTAGDSLSELVNERCLGVIAKNGDVDDVAEAILKLAEDQEFYSLCVQNIKKISKDYTWEKVCRPIISFCEDPIISAYKKESSYNQDGSFEEVPGKVTKKEKGIIYLIRKFFYHFFHSGPRKTARYLSNYVSRK